MQEFKNEKVNTYTEFVNHEQTKAMDLISFISQPGSNTKWPIPKNTKVSKKFKSNTNLSKSPKNRTAYQRNFERVRFQR